MCERSLRLIWKTDSNVGNMNCRVGDIVPTSSGKEFRQNHLTVNIFWNNPINCRKPSSGDDDN